MAQNPVLHSTSQYNWLQNSKANNGEEIYLAVFFPCSVMFPFLIYRCVAYLPKGFLLLPINKQKIVKTASWWRKTSQSVREHLCTSYSFSRKSTDLKINAMQHSELDLHWCCLESQVAGITACRRGGEKISFDCYAIYKACKAVRNVSGISVTWTDNTNWVIWTLQREGAVWVLCNFWKHADHVKLSERQGELVWNL